MSYTAREQSAQDGHPLELYRFALGDSKWLYTSADHEVAFGEDAYQPLYIRRGSFTRSGDANKATLDIEVGASNPVALLFRTGWLTAALIVTVYRHHYEDSEFSVLWKGRVTGCKWSGSTATLTTDSVFTLFQRAGLRRVYQVGCPHVLYGAACGLNAASWAVGLAASAVSGNHVAVPGAAGYPAGWFTGGMLQVGAERRMVAWHSGSTIVLVDAVAGLTVGASVTLWPGCGRSVDICDGKFGNLDNYGGLPFLPGKNPFSGDALV